MFKKKKSIFYLHTEVVVWWTTELNNRQQKKTKLQTSKTDYITTWLFSFNPASMGSDNKIWRTTLAAFSHWWLTDACYLLFDELQLHVLDFNPHQQEVDFSNNHIFQVISTKQTHRGETAEVKDESLKVLYFIWKIVCISDVRCLSSHLDLLYSNSMWRQSSMPTSILIELLTSG